MHWGEVSDVRLPLGTRFVAGGWALSLEEVACSEYPSFPKHRMVWTGSF